MRPSTGQVNLMFAPHQKANQLPSCCLTHNVVPVRPLTRSISFAVYSLTLMKCFKESHLDAARVSHPVGFHALILGFT